MSVQNDARKINKDDLFYVCSLIEFTSRKTFNRRGCVASAIGEKGIRHQLSAAGVNHCLSFEQVSDELVDVYKIPTGDFDTISQCRYTVPGFLDIGRLYQIMISDCAQPYKEVQELLNIFSSFISDEISDFETGMYYQSPAYLEACYKDGKILE